MSGLVSCYELRQLMNVPVLQRMRLTQPPGSGLPPLISEILVEDDLGQAIEAFLVHQSCSSTTSYVPRAARRLQ